MNTSGATRLAVTYHRKEHHLHRLLQHFPAKDLEQLQRKLGVIRITLRLGAFHLSE